MDSPIWSATVNTGLSEVIGSWKIIAISAPRMPRIVAPSARARSAREPSRRAKSMLPPVMRPPPCSTSRMIDSAVTDLPEPDSPTTATVSPRPTSKETPRTARTTRSVVANSTLRPSTTRAGEGFTGRRTELRGRRRAGCAGSADHYRRRSRASQRTIAGQTFSGSCLVRFISSAGTGRPCPNDGRRAVPDCVSADLDSAAAGSARGAGA